VWVPERRAFCVVCERCAGKGWMKPIAATDFPSACPVCEGDPIFTSARLARRIHEDRRTVINVLAGRARKKTTKRCLRRLRRLFRRSHAV
jgi:hypothetical protein